MSANEVTQNMLSRALEGITGIQIDQGVVVVAMVGLLIIYVGFRIVIDAIAAGIDARDYNYEDDRKLAEWHRQGSLNGESVFDRDVARAKYNRMVKKYAGRY